MRKPTSRSRRSCWRRKQLTAGRFELESRLGQLKELDHPPGDGEQKEEEDSEDEELEMSLWGMTTRML